MKKATIADVAEKAGVSKATVSRYLKQENVRKEIAERVQAAIEETGYVAKSAPKPKTVSEPKASTVSKEKKAVQVKNYKFAILSCNPANPSAAHMIEAIGRQFHQAGCLYQLYNTQCVAALEEKYLTACIVQNVNAVFIESCTSAEFIQKQMRTTSIPVIFLREKEEGLQSFAFDEREAGRILGNDIITRRHLMVRYLGVDQKLAETRMNGVRDVYHAKKQPVDLLSTFCEGSYLDMYEKIKGIFSQNIDLLILENDEMAIPLHKFLREYHIAVPQNVSVISFGGQELVSVLSPVMACIHYDYKGYAAGLFAYACSLIEGTAPKPMGNFLKFQEGDSVR